MTFAGNKLQEAIDVTQKVQMGSLQPDAEGNYYIKTRQDRTALRQKANKYILDSQFKDPREGFGKVFIWDEAEGAYDEKVIRDYQAVQEGRKPNVQFASLKKDLRKKQDRLYNISPDTKAVVDYAAKAGDSPEMVEAWLINRGYGAKETLKTTKKLSAESQLQGGDKIEGGHEISFRADVGEGKRPATDQYTYFYEPFEENRGLGRKGGSNKHINLNVAAGTVPRQDIEGYEFFKAAWLESNTGEVNPLSPIKEEFSQAEQKLLREVPSDAPAKVGDQLKTDIYESRDAIRDRTDIELTSGKNKRLSAKGLYRNIARAAGKSNNPLVNISGDIVAAIMDGAAYMADPSADNAVDLALSGSQAVISLAALGLAAVPIPGGRPGAFMLMKIGDNVDRLKAANDKIAQVERLWNLTSKIDITKRVADMNKQKNSAKVQKAQEVIDKQVKQEQLTGTTVKTPDTRIKTKFGKLGK